MKNFLVFSILMSISAIVFGQEVSIKNKIASLPSIPFLPDPLVIDEGGKNIPVESVEQWNNKKEWIRRAYQQWISGTRPPAPKNLKSQVLSEQEEDGFIDKVVKLSFGPEEKAKMTIELLIPKLGGKLPVLMTQWNHRSWAEVAVGRGYIGCIYAGADSKDDTKDYDQIFKGYDFATLMKRAWGASRVVDYLYELPEVDTGKIAITGHSRNGKQSLMAAGFDERIKAVVSSSGGTGGESSFRWSDNRFTPGSFDRMISNFPNWFSQNIRFFEGQEQKLPVDQNSLMSLIAPRGLMMVSAITEHEGNPWGVGQSYKSVKKVYHFFGADSKVAILLRRGRHQHALRDIEDFLDFFDYIFGRTKIAPGNQLYYDYSFKDWKERSREYINLMDFPINEERNHLELGIDEIKKKINWLLGDTPPYVLSVKPFSPYLNKNKTYEDDYLEEVIGSGVHDKDIAEMKIGPYSPLGNDMWGAVYFPKHRIARDSVVGKLPLIIFLHGYSYATGYHRNDAELIKELVKEGYAVLAMDMIGFGTRIEEALHFYDRYPHWSLLGKMVYDVRSVIDDAYNRMPFVDSSRIYLAGNSLGGTVALFSGALDKRIRGLSIFDAFSSLREDNNGTEGIRHYYDLHGLLPRLGFFDGNEERIPIDFDDLLSCTLPKNILVIAPQRDRNHSVNIVRKIIERTERRVPDFSGKIELKTPDAYAQFDVSHQKEVLEWFSEQMKLR